MDETLGMTLKNNPESTITSSRDAIRAAFQTGLIEDGDGWMDTIKSRNRSSQTYDENTANVLAETISKRYLPLFESFKARMEALAVDTP